MSSPPRPYGTWRSPVTARAVAGKSLRFGALQGDGETLYWSESRPDEGGRGVIMRAGPEGVAEDVLPLPFSARSKVHEYGGGEYLAAGENVYFVDADSQDIYAIAPGASPRRLTRDAETRFADLAPDLTRGRLIAIAERHRAGGDPCQRENFIAAVPAGGGGENELDELARGRDFYASARVSPDGRKLAWLAWDLPHMPWEQAALYIAEIAEDGSLGPENRIAGGDGSAVFQPAWAPGGRLFFIWDRSGFGMLHAWDGTGITQILDHEGELMRPLWVFGMQSYAILDEARIAAAFIEQGETRLGIIDAAGGGLTFIDSALRGIDSLAPFGGGIALIGAGDTTAPAVVALKRDGNPETLRSAGDPGLSPDDISRGEMLRFEGDEGDELYALFYPPANACVGAPGDERPPLIVFVHGGPTGMADRGLKLKVQYWTSRGFAVCDLDYSGSAGYGRAYRERLNGQWGIRDVADVAALIRHLTGTGKVDGDRLLISGGSAGGYTVLMALAELDIFSAGACSYGVADLSQLQRITHKFESGYLYALTGTDEETCEAVFAERSPINRANEITCPVIFFQGLEDKVVPPEQSRSMARTLRMRGVPVTIREFANEAHGFRRAETIIEVLECEYAFYARVLGLEPAEVLPDIVIDNWRR
ncbi:prolyl tripeptidyl peptidase precursor [bacterium BMS3Bbin10]|nr:prolyl tripeptidyl peptidase precursor [bacterium BMS3Bbin10]